MLVVTTPAVGSFDSHLPFNAGIKSLHATLPDEIFTGDFASWTVYFV
jgi:hypothetical protein